MPARKTSARDSKPWVGVIMGSSSDLKYMQAAIDVLRELEVPHEAKIVSAHRTPDWMFEYASSAESRGLEVIIAAAGGSAHLPGMVAAKFHNTLAEMIVEVARRIGEKKVLLTGGCFQNRYLTEQTVRRLEGSGFHHYWHQRVPPNDGGIALGQAVWAAWSEQRSATPCV